MMIQKHKLCVFKQLAAMRYNDIPEIKKRIEKYLFNNLYSIQGVISVTIVGSFVNQNDLSGISDIDTIVICDNLNKEIFDLDIHKIPPGRDSIAHTHYDVRFLLEADPVSSKIIVSEESYDVAWIPIQKVLDLNSEPSIERMLKKTLQLKKQQNI